MFADDGFFSRASLGEFGFRWLHILAGITWIGLLYYFNFVQVGAFAAFEDEPHKEIGGKARLIAIDKVTRKALWWFRWSAAFTFLTGILITGSITPDLDQLARAANLGFLLKPVMADELRRRMAAVPGLNRPAGSA